MRCVKTNMEKILYVLVLLAILIMDIQISILLDQAYFRFFK